jgi:hypothetical protein
MRDQRCRDQRQREQPEHEDFRFHWIFRFPRRGSPNSAFRLFRGRGGDAAAHVCLPASRRQLEGIAKAKAAGVYKGRPPSIEASRVRELKEGYATRRHRQSAQDRPGVGLSGSRLQRVKFGVLA